MIVLAEEMPGGSRGDFGGRIAGDTPLRERDSCGRCGRFSTRGARLKGQLPTVILNPTVRWLTERLVSRPAPDLLSGFLTIAAPCFLELTSTEPGLIRGWSNGPSIARTLVSWGALE